MPSDSRCLDMEMEGWEWDSLKDISLASSGFNASFFGFSNLCDMAVHGVLCEMDQ